MARKIHGVDGELLRKKRHQRSEILKLGADCVKENQRGTIARLLIAEADPVGNPEIPGIGRGCLSVLT
jgi:hypothetical protein